MTTYNGIKYLKPQLDSILKQERKADEVLIYDDGSTDGTAEFIKNYINNNNLVASWKLVVNKDNKGWRRNFMEGMWNSTGDLIFPCDQDDIWHENKLKVMEELMIGHPEIKVLTTGVTNLYDDKIRKMSENQSKELKKVSWEKFIFRVDAPGCVFCIRKEIVKKSKKYYKNNYAHDDYFWKLGLFTDGLYNYAEDTIDYRRHNDSAFSVEVRKNRNVSSRLEWINIALDYCDSMTEYVMEEKIISSKEEKIGIIARNREYLKLRKKFYITGDPILIFRMIKYKDCYLQSRQLLGDIYIRYINSGS